MIFFLDFNNEIIIYFLNMMRACKKAFFIKSRYGKDICSRRLRELGTESYENMPKQNNNASNTSCTLWPHKQENYFGKGENN